MTRDSVTGGSVTRDSRARGLVTGDSVFRDSGSATVWMLVLCLVVWAAGMAATVVGAAVLARHRAESSADLAALAAAREMGAGAEPCPRATAIAARAGVRLVSCAGRADGSVVVVVEADLPRPVRRWLDLPPARARARAGALWTAGPAPGGG